MKRRVFLRFLGGSCALAVSGGCQGLAKSADVVQKPDKPDIVFIFADDLGYADLGCYGHPYAKTPLSFTIYPLIRPKAEILLPSILKLWPD